MTHATEVEAAPGTALETDIIDIIHEPDSETETEVHAVTMSIHVLIQTCATCYALDVEAHNIHELATSAHSHWGKD